MKLSPAGQQILSQLQQALLQLVELDRVTPHEVDVITRAVLAHFKSWRPMALLPEDVK